MRPQSPASSGPAGQPTGSAAGRSRSPRGDSLARALHLWVLATFAVPVPLFDLLGRQGTFFVAHQAGAYELLTLVAIFSILLPGVLILVNWAVHRVSRRAGEAVHLVSMFLLTATVLLTGLRKIGALPGAALVIGALLLGVGGAILGTRSAPYRTFLTFLAPVILIAPFLFLFVSPVRELLLPAPQPSAAVHIEAETPVVMIVFDALSLPSLLDSSGQIDSGLFPGFAALARDAHWFRQATTVALTTRYAVPAILTGNYPRGDHLPTYSAYPESLFRLWSDESQMQVFETITGLCPPGLCRGGRWGWWSKMTDLLADVVMVYPHVLLPPDLTAALPSVTRNWRDFRGATRRRRGPRFATFLESIRTRSAGLYFIHSQLPHAPWEHLPSGKSYRVSGTSLRDWASRAGRWVDDEWLVIQSFQRYLLQLLYVDNLLRETLGALAEAGLYDRALIVVTADHGVSIRPGGRRRSLDGENVAEIVRVPLLVKVPFQRRGSVDDRNAETIDILPTVADALGVELPWPTDGSSLIDPDFEARPRKVIFRPGHRMGARMELDLADLGSAEAAVRRKHRWLGGAATARDVFRMGPQQELIGRSVSEIASAGGRRVEALLADASSYLDVDPTGRYVPARISGWLPPGVQTTGRTVGRRALAIGINGTIRAVTWTFESPSQSGRFTAMVPERSFSAGRNQVEVLDVTDRQPAEDRVTRDRRSPDFP